jgi:hypothetical protein
MDPISIATASACLVRLSVTVSGYIYTYVSNNRNVDTTIRFLAVEIDSLAQVVSSIQESFSDPSLADAALSSQTGHEGNHWRNVRRSMNDCENTLKHLEQVMEKVKKGKMGMFGRAVKLQMNSVEITLLKQQIGAYRETLQLSLHMITVYIIL